MSKLFVVTTGRVRITDSDGLSCNGGDGADLIQRYPELVNFMTRPRIAAMESDLKKAGWICSEATGEVEQA